MNPTMSFDVPKEHLTQLRSKSRSAIKGCCECVYKDDGVQPAIKRIKQLGADGINESGETDKQWKAEIIIDGTSLDKKMIYISTRMKAVNETGNVRIYPDTVYINDEELSKHIQEIPPEIRIAWNSRKYKIRIIDKKCGERIFEVAFNPIFVNDGSHHYTVNFVNVSMFSGKYELKNTNINSNRSYVSPNDFSAKFNLRHDVDPHEYGHMLGLIDEYKDVPNNRNGVKYTYYNNVTETIPANNHLMGRSFEHTAKPARYCLTIAYAVVRILEKNGCKVTNMEILGLEDKK